MRERVVAGLERVTALLVGLLRSHPEVAIPPPSSRPT
jgi:hypothetical protein